MVGIIAPVKSTFYFASRIVNYVSLFAERRQHDNMRHQGSFCLLHYYKLVFYGEFILSEPQGNLRDRENYTT